jgi:putative ABC transport system substrate-binding protein
MQRREFISILGGTAITWPIAVRARQPALPVIGFVNSGSPKGHERHLAAFIKGLGEASYVEGRNVAIEYRWAENQINRLSALMADLVHRQVAVIVATTTPAAVAAKDATTTIPIVFEIGGNPAEFGLTDHDNITGVAQFGCRGSAAPLTTASPTRTQGGCHWPSRQPGFSRSCRGKYKNRPDRGANARIETSCSERWHRTRPW